MEARVPGEKPRLHGVNVQTPHKDLSWDLSQEPPCYEVKTKTQNSMQPLRNDINLLNVKIWLKPSFDWLEH